MRNFIQPGNNIDLVSPADVLSGQPVLVGDLFGVATSDSPTGSTLVIATTGVFTLPKVTADDITVGAAVYFDGTEVTLDDTQTFIGHAVSAAANPSATVAVRLSV